MYTPMVIAFIPVAFFMLLRWPINHYLNRAVKPEDKAGVPYAAWTLLYCIVEGGVPGRLGLAPNQLFLLYVIGALVLAMQFIRTLRTNSADTRQDAPRRASGLTTRAAQTRITYHY